MAGIESVQAHRLAARNRRAVTSWSRFDQGERRKPALAAQNRTGKSIACPTDQKPPASVGFTLVELLVALSVFAIIAAAAGSSLSLALATGSTSKRVSAEMAGLTRARSLMRDDFLQLVPRPARDPFGSQPAEVFEGGFFRDRITIARFSRRGRVNPGGRLARGGIQHVQYLYQGGQILRRTYPRIDPAPDAVPFDQILFAAVSRVDVRFLVDQGWQPVYRATAGPDRLRLQAVELVIQRDNGDRLRLVFYAGGRP